MVKMELHFFIVFLNLRWVKTFAEIYFQYFLNNVHFFIFQGLTKISEDLAC